MSLHSTLSLKQFFAVKRHDNYGTCDSRLSVKRKLSVSSPYGRATMQLSKPDFCILVLPTEVIEKVITLVDDLNDLRSLTYVSRLFASIACHIYATRHGIHVTNTSCLVKIQRDSFQALATWRRSRLFARVQNKHLICILDDRDLILAKTQIKALRTFLAVPFIGRPFVSVTIHYADCLSPSEILQFIECIDHLGCESASISSGLCNPKWFNPSPGQKLPTISLLHLKSLDIDHQYLSARQWSSLLFHLTGRGLEALFIRGQPTIHALSKFLSRHSHIRRLRFTSRWANHTRCMKPGSPQEIFYMPLLSEMEGPPCHLQALLSCFSRVPDALTIKAGQDSRMTYMQYVRGVLRSVNLCGPHVHLEIHFPARYVLNDNVELNQSEMKSLTAITLPEVASLEISFPPISEGVLLACCTQWFTLLRNLTHITIFVNSSTQRQKSLSSTDIVIGPRNGRAIFASKVRLEWDGDLE